MGRLLRKNSKLELEACKRRLNFNLSFVTKRLNEIVQEELVRLFPSAPTRGAQSRAHFECWPDTLYLINVTFSYLAPTLFKIHVFIRTVRTDNNLDIVHQGAQKSSEN